MEIDTNLGISGSYILEAIKDRSGSKFVTMEGLSQLCDISSKQFSSIVETSKYEIRQGLYDLTFPELISEKIKFDLMFIDGNHKKEPTIEYFNKLKCKISDAAIFIFDDINWSSGMKEAWKIIKNDKDVNFSLDFYKLGIVIIDKNEKLKGINFELFLTY